MTGRERFRHVCLALVLATAVASFALSYESGVVWTLAAFPAAALFLTLPALPPPLANALVWVSRALILAAALGATGVGFPYVIGIALAVLAGVFLLARRSFTPGGAFLPAALGVFLLAAANPLPKHFAATAWVGGAALAAWLLSASPLATYPRRLAVAALFLLPAAAIGEGILRFLPWAQPHVETVAFKYIHPQSADVGVGLGSSLGSIEQLGLSTRVVLRLWSERPLALRAGVFTQFTGSYWQASKLTPPARALMAGAVEAPPEWAERVPGAWLKSPAPAATTRGRWIHVVVESPIRGVLPAPSSVQAVRLAEPTLLVDRFGVLQAPGRQPEVYGVIHADGPEPALEDDPMVAECLRPPPALDPRVRALAESLGPGDATPRAKIERTVRHLRSGYEYALKVGKWKTRDPLSEFLFDKKKGYCEYFATAAAVLLRLQGVPARYVSGLSVRDENWQGAYYLVRAGDAHAWAEALVPGAGWVEVDATPPGQYKELHAPMAPTALERWMEAVKARWAELVARVREGGWGVLWSALGPVRYLLLAAIATMVLARFLRRHRRTRGPAPAPTREPEPVDPELRACLARLEQLWTSAGHTRPAHRGPLEHVAALPKEQEALRQLSLEVVDCFYRGAYGGQPIPREETARLSQALSGFVPRGSSRPEGALGP
jgi:transglutaminase-like putative cysteine protease